MNHSHEKSITSTQSNKEIILHQVNKLVQSCDYIEAIKIRLKEGIDDDQMSIRIEADVLGAMLVSSVKGNNIKKISKKFMDDLQNQIKIQQRLVTS